MPSAVDLQRDFVQVKFVARSAAAVATLVRTPGQTCRTNDIIIRGGENIPVKEIEDLLVRHPPVRGVVLVGLPDPRLGEIAYACVIPESGEPLTLEPVRAFLSND